MFTRPQRHNSLIFTKMWARVRRGDPLLLQDIINCANKKFITLIEFHKAQGEDQIVGLNKFKQETKGVSE